jgi:hypothetical protein
MCRPAVTRDVTAAVSVTVPPALTVMRSVFAALEGLGHRLEPLRALARNRYAREPLDVPDVLRLLRRYERDCVPGRLGSGRSPDPVHVVLGHVRHVEIDHMRDAIHVDPARRDIRRHEHTSICRS